jgi:NDP-sugar pyrophosphorylase family protein
MQCVVLAGGLGTRMRHWSAEGPKALIPVLGRPFAERQMEWLATQGVKDVVYSIGYRGEMLRAALGDGSRWGVAVRYVDEGTQLRGTAGALRLALDHHVLDPAFFVLYGDSYLTVELAEVWQAFLDCGAPALMTVFHNDGQWDRSNVDFRCDRVTRYQKGASPADGLTFIDYGLSVLSRATIETFVPPGTVSDLGEVFSHLSLEGRLAGFEVTKRFYEIGSEGGLRSLEAHLTGTPAPDGATSQSRP